MDSTFTCTYNFSSETSLFSSYARLAQTCPESKLSTQPNLGLLDASYESDYSRVSEGQGWARLARYIQHLNEKSMPKASYKVLFVVRHGYSVHNLVMDEVGSVEWKRYWSKLEGDEHRTWFDAELVNDGVEQAKTLKTLLAEAVETSGLPLPETLYTSPLTRCLQTTRLVFKDLLEGQGKAFRPIVKELLRERITSHTCDRRRPAEWITAAFPEYSLENGFADKDLLWLAHQPESDAEHIARTQTLLENIWTESSGNFIALVTHSFTLSSILEAISVPQFRLGEGAMVAFVVRGEQLNKPLFSPYSEFPLGE